ncbi:chemotaxis protein CheW [Thalassotalea ganghwensis]
MEQEFLTFILNGEEFGVDILCVQEIRVMTTVTQLPNKPNYLKGVINLRGVIIPIIDLRQRFGQQPLEYDEQTVTIILKSIDQENPMVVGIIVDAVSEVYKFSTEKIRKAPSFGKRIDDCFIKGLATVEDRLIILLDTNALLDQDELYSVEASVNCSSSGESNKEVLEEL